MLLCSNRALSFAAGPLAAFPSGPQGEFVRSENSRYLALLIGGLAMGLAVIFASLYTALHRPLAF